MAITNRDRISRALDHLRDGLTPFVEQELEAHLGAMWQARVNQSRRFDIPTDEYGAFDWDSLSLLRTMFKFWNEVFKYSLSHSERSFVSELMTMRNEFAHEKQFNSDDAYRALDTAGRLLVSVAAPTEAQAIDAMRQELLLSVVNESCPPNGSQGDRLVEAPVSGAMAGAELDSEFDLHQNDDHTSTPRHDHAATIGAMGDLASLPFSLTEPSATATRERRSSKRARRNWALPMMAMIACLAIGVLGGGAWQGSNFKIETQVAEATTVIEDHWLHEFADYFLIFAEDDTRVVELGPDRKDLLESWFGKRIGRPLQVADLSAHGAEFKGGRLIPVEGQATALFVYQSDGGELFSVAITRAWSNGERDRASVRKSGLDMVYWSRAGITFVVMGQFEPALLDRISRDLELHFEKI